MPRPSSSRLSPTAPLYEITADTSPEGLARGKYLMEEAMMCAEACHSPEGKPFQGTAKISMPDRSLVSSHPQSDLRYGDRPGRLERCGDRPCHSGRCG